MERFDSLSSMYQRCWHLLIRSQHERNHPMRTPVIGCVSAQEPTLRTVVLRKVELPLRQLYFYTDRRSAKVAQIEQQGRLTWLFWDPGRRVQIRASGPTEALSSETAQPYWQQLSKQGRKSYATEMAPGSPSSVSTEGLSDQWEQFDLAATETYFTNFRVFRTEVQTMDLLHLHPEGHQRAGFQWDTNNQSWNEQWLIP